MFDMLSCFNPKADVTIDEFRCALVDHTAHLQTLDLVDSTGPSGRRQANTIMDTDNQGFFDTGMRLLNQCCRN